MKRIVFIVFIFSGLNSIAQLSNHLCKSNEAVAFAFQLKNKKWVSVCRDKNDKYLVYRFGTKDKIELTYPALLDTTSWQQFSFWQYSRGGGKQNAAMEVAFLTFSNMNTDYEVYETWTVEEGKPICGITVNVKGKSTSLKGVLSTRKNYLRSLRDTPVKLQEP